MVNTHARVENILRVDTASRSSDKRLLLIFWAKEGLLLSKDQQKQFMECTSAETITRARRKLRSSYPGTAEAEEGRYKQYKEFRDEYGNPVMRLV